MVNIGSDLADEGWIQYLHRNKRKSNIDPLKILGRSRPLEKKS